MVEDVALPRIPEF